MTAPADRSVRLLQGDAREVQRELPAESVHCVVTSPPYWGLRDYGLPPSIWGGEDGCEHEWGEASRSAQRLRNGAEGGLHEGRAVNTLPVNTELLTGAFCCRCRCWRGSLGLEPTPELFVEHLVEVMRAVRRVLRRDGTLWLNMGDCYAGGHVTYSDKCWQHGAGPNVNMHVLGGNGLKPKDLVGMPWRVAFALQADGWWLRSAITWCKGSPMPESAQDRPTSATEMVFLLTKSPTYFYDNEAVRVPSVSDHPSGNGYKRGARLTYDGRGSDEQWKPSPSRNLWNWWLINPQPSSLPHFATFPEALVEPCILAGTSERGCCPECGALWTRVVEKETREPDYRKGNRPETQHAYHGESDTRTLAMVQSVQTVGWRPSCKHEAEPVPCTVLDPFVGSGTTAAVAARLGRRAIGIDLSEAYLRLAEERVAKAIREREHGVEGAKLIERGQAVLPLEPVEPPKPVKPAKVLT